MTTNTDRVLAARTHEAAVRDLAGRAIGLRETRKAHPSYGVTLAALRGAVGVYAVLTGQAFHPHVPANTVTFPAEATTARVAQALAAADRT